MKRRVALQAIAACAATYVSGASGQVRDEVIVSREQLPISFYLALDQMKEFRITFKGETVTISAQELFDALKS